MTLKPIYLMDASAFIHRSFHALRNLTNKKGQPTGAVYGFTTTLLKLLKDKDPKHLAVVFDSRGPGARHGLYPDYKANRKAMDEDLVAQQEPIRQMVKALGLFMVEETGFEADDLIAAATRKFGELGAEIVIVSADKDFYQLLSEKISMYDPDPKKESALTIETFQERYGVEPAAFLDMQALMGDSSDNIPGVPKVGEKTALKLIAQFGSLDNLYNNLDDIPEKLRVNLATHRESAYLSRELASLGHGAAAAFTLDDLKPAPQDETTLRQLLLDLDFSRLLKELFPTTELFTPTPKGKVPTANIADSVTNSAASDSQSPSEVSYDKYILVTDDRSWDKLLNSLKKAKILSIDLETDSPSPSRCAMVGLSLCAEAGEGFYIPIDHRTLGAQNQKWELVKERLAPYLVEKTPLKVGQNAKFDWLILARNGLVLPPPTDDPMLASYILDPEGRHGLDYLADRHLNHQTITFKELVPAKGNFGDITPEEALNYAAEDADVALRLASLLREQLTEKQLALYEEVELPLEALLAKIEGIGVLIETKSLGELSQELSERLRAMEENIYSLAGRPFNIGSPKQLAEVLFQEQGLTPLKKTAKKTGYSTDDEVLAELALTHPLPKEIRAWRSLDKLRSTYTDKLPKTVNPQTGRIHTNYNQILTATGRLSSADPNLQNIPVRSPEGRRIRASFVAPEGFALIAADYSQIELRVLAHFSQDEALRRAFAEDLDVHTQTAAEIFGLGLDEVTPQLRREAKTINFGVVYGQGPFALGKQLGIPQAQARDFIERYFQRFPGVKRYMDESRQQAHETGQVSTWFGRTRTLRGLTGGYQAKQEAERMAINTPIQGTAADLIKMAMLAVDKRLSQEHPSARLIMQVHDELVVEAPLNEAEQVGEVLRQEMAAVGTAPPLKGAKPITVPLKVDVGFGQTWADAH